MRNPKEMFNATSTDGRQTLPWDYFLLARHSGTTATLQGGPRCRLSDNRPNTQHSKPLVWIDCQKNMTEWSIRSDS